MAKIYPEHLPESIISDPRRQAECKVYSALKTLPNKYIVFYSVHWHTLSDSWGVSEGEADFIVAHPDMGVIVLEVKGGGIRFDSANNTWYSYSANGNIYPIKDPIDQGRRNHYALLDQLKSLPAWSGDDFNIGHAVCFPDILLHGQRLKPDLPSQMVIDRQGLEDVQIAIPQLFQTLFGQRMSTGMPRGQGIRLLENHLARSFELRTPLGVEIDNEDQKLVQLTEQQFFALSILGDRKRVAIGGCAGSGKTMLALEKARQFSDSGLNVLLTCYNAPLAAYLKQRLPDVDIFHFHDLCREAARKVGENPFKNKQDPTYFDYILPDLLLNASEEIGRVYDAIIIDEGQDFKVTFWLALESLLKKDGHLFAFFDNNQNIYDGELDFGGLISEQPFQLTQNCRNTKEIYQTVIRFHNNPQSLHCDGPIGRPPEVLTFRDVNDELSMLSKILHRLVVEENIHPSDIAILTTYGRKATPLGRGTVLGNFTLSEYPSSERNAILATSIRLFKGLEKKVIILTGIHSLDLENFDTLMYVGCSRARTHLIILCHVNAFKALVDSIRNS